MKVTNTQPGPRGINAKTGPVLIDPGQSVEVDVSEDELKVSKATGWFEISGEPEEDEGLDRDDLKKQATELGIAYPANVKSAKLKELIDAKLSA